MTRLVGIVAQGGNYLDSTCAGKCSAGYYCSAGSGSATQNACPSGDKSVYCPAGSAEPVAVSPGYKAASGQTKQEPCPAGSYCSGGVQKDCPVGRYGSASGLFTAECSGECQAGCVALRIVAASGCAAACWSAKPNIATV